MILKSILLLRMILQWRERVLCRLLWDNSRGFNYRCSLSQLMKTRHMLKVLGQVAWPVRFNPNLFIFPDETSSRKIREY